jgi:AcrR family transcriptional regulator
VSTAAPEEPPEARRAGRPRSAALDEAILDAALHLLSTEGYARMSMDGVAARAAVSKATIYLRYEGKADLATAALERLRVTREVPPTGDPRTDLVADLRQIRRNAESVSVMRLIGTCLTEEAHTPELLELFRARTLRPRRRFVADMLERACAAGLIRPDADLGAAIDLYMGAYHSRYLSGEDVPEGWEESIVDAVLRIVG